MCNNIYRQSILTIFISSLYLIGLGQNRVITGIVTNENGEPLPYTSVSVKGTRITTGASPDGKYRLEIPFFADSIICTHVGYADMVEGIKGSSVINIGMSKKPYQLSASIEVKHHFTDEEARKIKTDVVPTGGDDWIFTRVEVNAEFPGGKIAIRKYFEKNIIYTDSAVLSYVKGLVKVGFTINIDGDIKDIRLIKGVNKIIDEAVIAALSKMPRWKPAIQNGRNVEDYKELEVSFDIVAE